MTKPKLSIIIVNWNTQALLKQCLDSIIDINSNQLSATSNQKISIDNQSPAMPVSNLIADNQIELIIVDNGSSDGSVEMIKSLITDYRLLVTIRLIENKENHGFGKANNQGIKVATGKYIMLLNSDTIVKPGSLSTLISYLDNNSNIAVIGPKLLNSDGSPQPNCGPFPNPLIAFIMLFLEHFFPGRPVRYSPTKVENIDWLMGAAIVARNEVFKEVGGLDEGIFMYMEEVEWFYRVKQAGYKAQFIPTAEIVHLGRGSSKSGKKEPILNIYRGLLHFYRKHHGITSLLLLQVMLKLKAILSYLLGLVTNNKYLKETYGEAFKIC